MATFVLVHGSWHGAWCWEGVARALVEEGHGAVAVDLPGHGADTTPIVGRTLASYVDRVVEAIERATQPVVLVAHSMGGVIATQTAERVPDRIARVVYVCAFLPIDGQSLLDLAKTDTDSTIFPSLVFDEPGGVHSVLPEGRASVFYGECTPEVAARASARLIDEALAPVATPVHVTKERFGRVPRSYVRTTRDRCLSVQLQDRMLAATPCAPVVTLDTDHSPFLSRPVELVRTLVQLA